MVKEELHKEELRKIMSCHEREDIPESGVKHDAEKPRWDLIPFSSLDSLAQVITYGARKYGENNWQGVSQSRQLAATFRHLSAYMKGEKTDRESGMSHLAHAFCDIAFAIWKDKEGEKDVN